MGSVETRIAVGIAGLALAIAGCTPGDQAGATVDPPAEEGAAAPASVAVVDAPAMLTREEAIVLRVAPTGNEARYRVREQLVGRDLPNDAVGATSAVSGAIALDSRGNVLPASSRVVVDMTGLRSDQERRDGYLQRRLLETEQHPTVELRPTALRGISSPLPTTGSRSFEMTGDLTIKGVTRPTNWRVTAIFAGERVTGSATTAFTFDDFGLAQPRVPIVLSVADTIRLEYDFELLAGTPGS